MFHDDPEAVTEEDVEEALDFLTAPNHPSGSRQQTRAREVVENFIDRLQDRECRGFTRDTLPGRQDEEARREAARGTQSATRESERDPLLDMTVDEMKGALPGIDSVDRLDDLMDQEDRSTALDVISARLEELLEEQESEEEEAEEEDEEIPTSTGEGGSAEDVPGT